MPHMSPQEPTPTTVTSVRPHVASFSPANRYPLADKGKRTVVTVRRLRLRSLWVVVIASVLGVATLVEIIRIIQGLQAPILALVVVPLLWLAVAALIVDPVTSAVCAACRASALRISLAVGAVAMVVALLVESITTVTPQELIFLGVDAAIVVLGLVYGVNTLRRTVPRANH